MRDGQGPKYLNSNEGEVFHKRRQLYGLDVARAAAAREGRVVLVEGYTDVVALHQAGIGGAVGTMGTALTEQQADALIRLAPTALLCLDADAAGIEAMLRGLESVERADARRPGRQLELRIVELPTGSDPADLVAGEGAEALRRRLDNSLPVKRFLIERALASADVGSAEGRDRVIGELRPIFAELPDGFLYQELLQLVSDRLDTSPEVLARLLPARGRRAPLVSSPRPEAADGSPFRRFEDTERAFLARCLAVPEDGRALLGELEVEALFTAELTRRAAVHLREHFDHPSEALPVDDDAFARLIAELVIRAGELGGDADALRIERLQLDLHRLDREIQAARRDGSPVGELARERQRVHEEIRHRLV
jgi:DNA primase